MKFSMAMATLVAANAVAAYEVPNDNTITKLAAGYEGKKPGSGSVRGSVQEFATDKAACKAAVEKAAKKYGFCVGKKASSAGHLKEAVAWGECLKKIKTEQDWKACDAAKPALAPYRKKCENKLENSDEVVKAKKACGVTSSFMTLMGSVEVFDALPFEAMAFEAAYEVPKDNTIANLAAGYEGSVQEFAADDAADAACDAAEEAFEKCADPIFDAKVKPAYDAAAKGACKSQYDAGVKACGADDTPSFTSVQEFAADDSACETAADKFEECAKLEQIEDAAYEEAATTTCKNQYDAFEKACGAGDEGESAPQM